MKMQSHMGFLQSLHGKKPCKPCKISKDDIQVTQITENLISHDGIVDKNTGKMKKYVISLFTDFPFIYFFRVWEEQNP